MSDSPCRMDPDDGPLFSAMAAGPPERARQALAELYGRHAGGLRAFLRRLGLGTADMDDILQDTFLRAARKAQAFRGGSARAWLCRLAADRAADLRRSDGRRLRREQRVARSEAVEAGEAGSTAFLGGDIELEKGLAALPESWRVALELRLGSGLSHGEVARVLGISLRTAKAWSARGRQALEVYLASSPASRRRAE